MRIGSPMTNFVDSSEPLSVNRDPDCKGNESSVHDPFTTVYPVDPRPHECRVYRRLPGGWTSGRVIRSPTHVQNGRGRGRGTRLVGRDGASVVPGFRRAPGVRMSPFHRGSPTLWRGTSTPVRTLPDEPLTRVTHALA